MKKILTFLAIIVSFSAHSQTLYQPLNTNTADSLQVAVNINNAPRKVYAIDLVKYRAALAVHDTATALRILIAANAASTATKTDISTVQARIKDSLASYTIYFDSATLGQGTSSSPIRNKLTITTTGSSGAATYSNNVLNIPQYTGGSASYDSIRVLSSNPVSGNIYIGSVDNRIHFKSGSYWYRVAIIDSAAVASGSVTTKYIDAGLTSGTSTYNGQVFEPDNSYLTTAGTSANYTDAGAVTGTSYSAFYQSVRYSTAAWTYTFQNIANGNYTIYIHLRAFSSSPSGVNIVVNGTTVGTNVDAYIEAGNVANKAAIKSYNVTVSGGQIVLGMSVQYGQVNLAGIEIVAQGTATKL